MEPDAVLCIDESDSRRCEPSLNICGCDWINSTEKMVKIVWH